MAKYAPLFAVILHISHALDCYDFASKFSIPCEESSVWLEECFSLYNKSLDGSWKLEDAGCRGKRMKSHLDRIMKEEGVKVKLSADKKAIFYSTLEGTTLLNCLDSFCNTPEKMNNLLEKELDEGKVESSTNKSIEEVPVKIKEDVIERLLSGKITRKKPFEVNNELGVNTHREIRPLIFSAPTRNAS